MKSKVDKIMQWSEYEYDILMRQRSTKWEVNINGNLSW